MIATDLVRGALLATIPLAYAFDALVIQQLYVVAFLVGTMTVFFHVSYSVALRLDRPAGELRRSELVPRRQPRLLVRRRAERRRHPRPGPEGAVRAGRGRLQLPRLGALSPLDLPGGAPDGGGRERARGGRCALRLGESVHAGVPARNRDDQPLQLHLLGALHPLRRPFPGRRARHARARPRRGRRRRRDRLADHDSARQKDRDRPDLPARVHPLSGAARARAAGGRPRSRSSSRCSSSRSSAAGSA